MKKKLSLEDLKVESFATQVSEKELVNLKGGTTWGCFFGGSQLILGLTQLYIQIYGTPPPTQHAPSLELDANPDGTYDIKIGPNVEIDSVKFNKDGSLNGIYKIQTTTMHP